MKTKKKATTTKKPKLSRIELKMELKINKLNAAYTNASPVLRRKMIAKDCLEQINENKFVPTRGIFTDVVLGSTDDGYAINPDQYEALQPLLHRPTTNCECCGVGAVFLSYVRLANEATDKEGHSFDEIAHATGWPEYNLRLIELAFETGKGVFVTRGDLDKKAVDFGCRPRLKHNAKARLKALLNNIIASDDGLFHP